MAQDCRRLTGCPGIGDRMTLECASRTRNDPEFDPAWSPFDDIQPGGPQSRSTEGVILFRANARGRPSLRGDGVR